MVYYRGLERKSKVMTGKKGSASVKGLVLGNERDQITAVLL